MKQNQTTYLNLTPRGKLSFTIDSRIESALEFCAKNGISRFVLAIPFNVPKEQIRWLRMDSRISGVVISTPDEHLQQEFGDWLGAFLPGEYTWRLPEKSAQTVVYIGKRSSLTFRMLKTSFKRGVRNIACKSPFFWIEISVSSLLFDRVIHYLAAKFHYVNFPTRLFLPAIIGQRKTTYSQVLAKGCQTRSVKREPKKGRVVLINSSLVAGGAERQIVNTIKGIREHGVEPYLVCEHLFDRPDHDFYLPEIQKLGVPVCQIEDRQHRNDHPKDLWCNPSVGKALSKLPRNLADDITVYYDEFRAFQPEIVHAWQDFCGIRAGIAGVLADVPRIVLSFRNVSPRHFHYYQSYLKPAYQALADCPNVIFTNNSLAGARDYARWLSLPLSRFRVIKNGVDFSQLEDPDETEKTQFRNKFGIPPSAPLIGSVFRFWPEKRPLLWMKMAAKVSRKVPEAHFVLMGWGPLQKKMEDLARQLNLQHCLHIIPPNINVAVPLSSLDMFVLTSTFEGIPNVVLESQWLGTPIVTTNAGGAPEAIDQNITGWVVKSAKPEKVAKQVVSVLCDAGRLKQAKVQGPAFVKREFCMKRMVDETLAAYGYGRPFDFQSFSEKEDGPNGEIG